MKLIKYMSLVVAVFAICSCGDNVLELDNLGTETSEIYFNDPENALAGLNACYSSVSKDEYFIYGDLMSDDALKGGSDLFDWIDREYIRTFTANSGNKVSNDTWSLLYTGIVRCNEIINSLPVATFDEELKIRIIGEAKFLRAYSYSKLVALFGPVPLVQADYSVDNLVEPRSSEAAIYEFVKTDLDDAILVLPERSRYAANDLGRVTKGAARAFKARVLMQESSYHYNSSLEVNGYPVATSEIWDEVYELTKDVIESGEYTLAANFATIFEEEGENNEESIFEIQHKTTKNDWGESVGNTTIVQMGNRDDWGWCFNLPTDALYNTFSSTDPRRECAIYGQEFNVLYGVEQVWAAQEWTLSHESTRDFVTACRLNRKYALEPDLRDGNHNNQPNNKRVIRYADVLLMHAEAAYYKGLEAEARRYVNMVRARAESSTYPKGTNIGQTSAFTYDVYPGASVAPITETGVNLLNAIWKERRMELAMEGIRYFDLVRTGRIDLLPFKANYTVHAGLLPIPVGDVNTFGLAQNKGY